MIKSIQSFRYALSGLITFFSSERNGKIQLLAATAAMITGGVLHISLPEWIRIVGCIATVLSFEMMNTAIEKTCDLLQPGFHPAIKTIKDVAAAAVLVAALGSAVIGALIFLPKILHLL